MSFNTVQDCKDQCAKDYPIECVAIEYNGVSKKCEIHTDTITHVSVCSVAEDAALHRKCQTECWKKQAKAECSSYVGCTGTNFNKGGKCTGAASTCAATC